MTHIFDVDYTIIKKPSAWYFLLEALKRKLITLFQIRRLPFEYIRYKSGFPNQDFIEETVKYFINIEKTVLEDLAESCFSRQVKKGIYTQAAQLIADLQSRKEPIFFATSSLDFMIRPLERFLGIEESIVSAMEFSEGKTTGRIVGHSCFGMMKKTAVEEWLAKKGIAPADVCFYSDSYTDLPLLEYCGKAVAVNPDQRLKRAAEKKGWEILRFRKTMNG